VRSEPRAQLAALDHLEEARLVIDRILAGHVPAAEVNVAAAFARDELAAAVVALEEPAGGASWPVLRYVPEGEASIEWVVDVDEFDYVRQAVVMCRRRTGRPAWSGGQVVGWSNLAAGAHRSAGRWFERRVFWLADHDRHAIPDGLYRAGGPCEAVDPRTVDVCVAGLSTPRSRGERTSRWSS
jgi:hypothetical protein